MIYKVFSIVLSKEKGTPEHQLEKLVNGLGANGWRTVAVLHFDWKKEDISVLAERSSE